MKFIFAAEGRMGTAGSADTAALLEPRANFTVRDTNGRTPLIYRCPPPVGSVVFDRDSLFSGGPLSELRVSVDTLVGFDQFGDRPQMAAAFGLVNGSSIRREPWPRRLAAYSIDAHAPIEIDGVQVASAGQSAASESAIWTGPSVLRWRNGSAPWGSIDDGPAVAAVSPVRIMSDGYWTDPLSFRRVDDDYVIRCRLAGHARWARIVSAAHVPPGHADHEPVPRRFGIAIVEINEDHETISLDSPALMSGFYPREGDAPRQWRWTNGSGCVALKQVAAERIFTVRFTNWHELLGS